MKQLGILLGLVLILGAWLLLREPQRLSHATEPAAHAAPGDKASYTSKGPTLLPIGEVSGATGPGPLSRIPAESLRFVPGLDKSDDQVVLFGTVGDVVYPHFPIPGALVQLFLREKPGTYPNQKAEMISGQDGSYWFHLGSFPGVTTEQLGMMNASVRAWADGYQPGIQATTPIGLVRGETQVDVELRAGTSLRGRVLKPSGRPAVGARLTLINAEGSYLGGARTDAKGLFFMAAPRIDFVLIEAHLEGYVPAALSLEGLDLVAQPDLGDLSLGLGGIISGRISCGDGALMPGLKVHAISGDKETGVLTTLSEPLSSTTSDEAGRFILLGLPGSHVMIRVENRTLGTFEVGSADVELTYPGRRLSVRVLDGAGEVPEGLMVSLRAGELRNGHVYASLATGLVPDRSRSVHIGGREAALVQVITANGYGFERLFTAPLDDCSWEEVLVMPPDLPIGQFSVALRRPFGEVIDTVVVELIQRLFGGRGYLFEGVGPHEFAEGSYEVTLSAPDAWEDSYLPIVIDPLEIKPGQVTEIDREVELGGRLSLLITSDSVGENEYPTARVSVRSAGRAKTLEFFDGSRERTSKHLPLDQQRLANHIFPGGLAVLEVRMERHQTHREKLRIIPGEILEHHVVLLPSKE